MSGSTGTPAEAAVFLRLRQYLAPQYALSPGPRANYLLFPGEPLLLAVEVRNWADHPVRLHVPADSVTAAHMFSLTLWRYTTDGLVQAPIDAWSEGPPQVRGPDGVRAASWNDVVELPNGGWVSIPIEIDAGDIRTPGTYGLRMAPIPVSCEPSCRIRSQVDELRFEVRAPDGLSEKLEILARRAQFAVDSGDPGTAEEVVAEMLRIHPASAVAYQLRALAAEHRGQWQRAEADFRRALAILERNQDVPLAEGHARSIQDRIRFVRERMREAAAKAGRNR
jgi:tetratricopeptide (TPR) repeat protein